MNFMARFMLLNILLLLTGTDALAQEGWNW